MLKKSEKQNCIIKLRHLICFSSIFKNIVSEKL